MKFRLILHPKELLMDMFSKHPDIVRNNISKKIDKLYEEATNEVLAKTRRLEWRQLVTKQIASNLRKLADRLELPQIPTPIPNTTQHLTKQAR